MPLRVHDITSAQNSLVRQVRSLTQRKQREISELFLSEGVDFAVKAKAHHFKPDILLIDRLKQTDHDITAVAKWADGEGARIATVSAALISRVTGKDNPQPLLLVCRRRFHELGELRAASGTVLALAGIRDPGNLGTILRTAEAAGCASILLVGDCCDPFSPECVRASMGSVFAAKLIACTQNAFVQFAGSWQGDVVGLIPGAQESYRSTFRKPVLLVLGGESWGLPDAVRHACSRHASIPMSPGVESLNVAASAAIMLYELQLPLIENAGPKG